ncbi:MULTISPECIES: ABC transporter permease [Bifidobacterium]|uniref:ABC transporter permease n=1 Tax=Bifidobacterium reuteri DSM 23975 TaxID=1437610 RepID=A0A087CNV2_9BIFI|nr:MULTISPECIES: ABC transporter permease [Bifidobacterium]KFI84952.1 ABC transporter permease [Bifidobacterium reuteri DSM 23975]TPF77593.1 ABC transporter permease [Bifidobacterium sp. UTCIF-1]TPF79891.1 ABC transporter permease [Bifidobacterium sp. UTCIF-24]TPF81524.1 ABC transporter permease [Bifidobacterium sp. UTCIF-3]TPF84404.1 ABC transporter permease [Bifidobacterium sp. UTCIF-36]
MFVLNNAWKTVIRNKGRNILIVLIVAIIAAAATIGLAIRSAADNARETGLANTSVTATISVDRSKLMEQAREASSSDSSGDSSSDTAAPDFDSMRSALEDSSLTLADYQKYEKASSVPVSSYYSESTGVSGTDSFQPVESSSANAANSSDSTGSSDADAGNGQGMQAPDGGQNMGGRGDGPGNMMTSGDFTLTGFSSDAAIANAANGSFTMSSGSVFGYDESDNGKVIISKTLADFNNLSVGDTITVTNPSDTSLTYTLTICGIYENSTSSNTNAMGPMGGTSQDADNAIYTSVSTLQSLGLDADTTANDDNDNTTTQLNYTYALSSADDYETFASDVAAAGLDDTYTVQSADVEQYESSLVPLDNLAKFALTLLIVVLAVGAVVLVVLNLFNIRERKYEVGVLTAIGVKKAKVAAQFVIELLIVTMCGIALGVAGGAVASVPVSNQLLASQVSAQESEASSQQQQFGRAADMGGGPGGAAGSSPSTGASNGSDSSDSDSTSDNGNISSGSTANSRDARSGGPFGMNRAVDYVSEINATVNLAVVGQLILIGLGLTLISALVGIVFVMRYEPLQILADRS